MAVYKKKDKTAKQILKDRAKLESESTTKEVFEGLDSGANKAEEWILKNQKNILTGLAVIVVGIFAYLGYTKFILEPKETEAANALAYPKSYFDKALNNTVAKDSLFSLALNGADGKDGLLGIVDNFGATKAGNLAKYYAGISYLKTADYKKAIEYLDDFSSDDALVSVRAKGAIGDAFANIGGEFTEDALNYYEEAISLSTNDYSTPIYLDKAATMALSTGNYKKAAQYYSRIKNDYPNSSYAKDIDGKIYRAKYASK